MTICIEGRATFSSEGVVAREGRCVVSRLPPGSDLAEPPDPSQSRLNRDTFRGIKSLESSTKGPGLEPSGGVLNKVARILSITTLRSSSLLKSRVPMPRIVRGRRFPNFSGFLDSSSPGLKGLLVCLEMRLGRLIHPTIRKDQ